MTGKRFVGFFIGISLTGSAVLADDPPFESAALISLGHCSVEYQRTALVGAPTPGVLQNCSIQLGDKVKAGQIMGRLQDSDLRAELDLRSAEALSDVEIRACTAKYNWQMSKLETAEKLARGHHLSAEEYKLQRLEVETAALTVEEAKHRRELAKLRRLQAEAGIHAREITSPIDGIVVKLFKTEGESVQFNDPVIRVVNTSVLKVIGALDVVDAWRVQPGNRVQINPEIGGAELPLENEEFLGRVVFIDSEIDPAAQTCTVIAEVDNRLGLLRAGIECRMMIQQNLAPSAAPKPGMLEGKRDTPAKERSGTVPVATPDAKVGVKVSSTASPSPVSTD